MAATRIQDLSAYSMAQIQQSLDKYNKDYAAYLKNPNRDSAFPGIFGGDPSGPRAQFKSASYGIEDEYRYMQSRGFVGERAAGSAPAAETQAETTATTKTDPVMNNVYGNEIDSRTTPGPTPKDFIDRFGGNKETYAHSGLSAVKRAEDAGLSIAQIQQMGIDQGISFGTRAQSYFNQQRQKTFDDQVAAIQQQNAANLQQLTIDQNTRLDKMDADQRRRSDELAAGQRTYQQNQARSGQLGALQIGGAAETPRTGGTQGFKRRKLQINPATADALSGILGTAKAVMKTNVLNV